MTPDELRARIADLSVWQRGAERAPHKPLLLLWALGRLVRGDERILPYTRVDEGLKPLLMEFGPPRRSYHTEYPFWYLRNDGLWELTGVENARVREGKADQPTKRSLVEEDAHGGLDREAWALLRGDPALVRETAHLLLDAHFPETYHPDILAAVGLDGLDDLEMVRKRRRRDPRFRDRVLIAYGSRCAVCGFDARLGHAPVGIEAAHIQWHQARGPDTVPNGMALCALHHKLFDRGAFSVDERYRVKISPLVNGTEATERFLWHFEDRGLQVPRDNSLVPGEEFVRWHRREVFRNGK